MLRIIVLAAMTLIAFASFGEASAACGDRGGPGYRSAKGRCVSWVDIGVTCGCPPTTRCRPENTREYAEKAAALGCKVLELRPFRKKEKVEDDIEQ